MFDGKAFGQEIVAATKAHVEKAVAPLLARIAELEKRLDYSETRLLDYQADTLTEHAKLEDAIKAIAAIPPPEPVDFAALFDARLGERRAWLMKDWAEFIPAPDLPDIPALVSEAVAALPKAPTLDEVVAAIPAPQNGKDADPEQVAALVRQEAERILAGWERPQDGKSVTVEDLMPMLDLLVSKAAERMPVPEDGKDGTNGKDGRDGLDVKELFVADGGELVAVFSDGRSKNLGKFRGENGKDGRDGFGFDDMEIEYDGKRTFAFVMKRAGDAKRYEFKAPVVIDCGVWKEGTQYETGDGVTWGGSYWIAQKDNGDKPDGGPGGSWRLSVKKGRDGKN